MPLYLVEGETGPKCLIYAKTPRGAKTAWLRQVSAHADVTKTTPLEAAVLASKGIPVFDVGGNMETVMEDDPEIARRAAARIAAMEAPQFTHQPYIPPVDDIVADMDLPDGAAAAMSDELEDRLAGDPLDGGDMPSYIDGEEDEHDPSTTAA